MVARSASRSSARRPGDCDARLLRRRGENLEVRRTERSPFPALDHEDSEHLVPGQQRHVHFGAAVETRDVPRLSGHVGGVAEPAVPNGPVAQALAGRDPHLDGNVGPADAGVEHPVAGAWIEEEEPQKIVTEGFIVQAIHDGTADVLLALRRCDGSAQPKQGRLPEGEAAVSARRGRLAASAWCRAGPPVGHRNR
jgi:hypothetical protein